MSERRNNMATQIEYRCFNPNVPCNRRYATADNSNLCNLVFGFCPHNKNVEVTKIGDQVKSIKIVGENDECTECL